MLISILSFVYFRVDNSHLTAVLPCVQLLNGVLIYLSTANFPIKLQSWAAADFPILAQER